MVWDFERRGLGGEGQGLRGEFAEDIRGQVPEDTAEIREDSHRPPGHRAARQLPTDRTGMRNQKSTPCRAVTAVGSHVSPWEGQRALVRIICGSSKRWVRWGRGAKSLSTSRFSWR